MKKTKDRYPRERESKRGAASAEEFAALLRSAEKQQTANGLAPEAALRAVGIKPTIIIIGSEQLRIKRLLSWVRKNIFDDGPVAQAVETYFGTEITSSSAVARIKETLLNLSLFARSKLVILYQADKIKTQFLKELAPAFERHAEKTVLVLTAEDLGAKTAAINDIAKQATLVQVSQLSGNQLRRWIEREALQAGATGIEPEAVEILLKGYGDDVTRLAQELAKLALLVPEDRPITRALAADLSLKTPERTSFELIEQIAKKGSATALLLTNELLAQGQHPLQLSSFLSRALRIMLAQKTLGSDAPLPQELGNQWFARNLSGAARGFSAEELNRAIELLKETDFKLKKSGLQGEEVMRVFVQRLTTRSFGPLRPELLSSHIL